MQKRSLTWVSQKQDKSNVDEQIIKLNIDTLQSYLQEEYGDRQFWLPPLQRMIKHKDRVNKWELKTVQQTLGEIQISVKS